MVHVVGIQRGIRIQLVSFTQHIQREDDTVAGIHMSEVDRLPHRRGMVIQTVTAELNAVYEYTDLVFIRSRTPIKISHQVSGLDRAKKVRRGHSTRIWIDNRI